jgi:16S rRNA (guanine527-N7)-methyltransferase
VDISVIAALLRPFAELSPNLLAGTSRYLQLLLRWNAKVNLTAIREPEEIVTRHFGESFFMAKALFPETLVQERRDVVVDVGSGAGFPGMPVAMFVPAAEVTLIEADGKKAAFLNEVIRELGLKNAEVFKGRAETYEERADLVMMRAVEKFERALPVAWDLVKDGGRMALMIGASQLEQTRNFARRVEWQEPFMVPGGRSRLLLVGIKTVPDSKR